MKQTYSTYSIRAIGYHSNIVFRETFTFDSGNMTSSRFKLLVNECLFVLASHDRAFYVECSGAYGTLLFDVSRMPFSGMENECQLMYTSQTNRTAGRYYNDMTRCLKA